MNECIFCQIVSGDKPASIIYQDDQFMAFLDIYPLGYGHTQIIPKTHHQHFWDIPNLDQLIRVSKKIITHYNQVLSTQSAFTLVLEELVPHAHLQIIPKTEANLKLFSNAFASIRQPQLDVQEAKEMVEKLKLT